MNRRNLFLNKTAGILLFTLVLSLIIPILAYAKVGFSHVDYTDSTVTGTVYATSDEGLSVTDNVYVDIYDPDGNKITTTKAVYSSVTGSTYYYTFSEDIGEYSYVKLLETVTDSVYATADRSTSGGNDGGGGGCGYCGGWGGGTGGTDTNGDGILEVTVGNTVDADKLQAALQQHTNITIKIDDDTIILPASALVEAQDEAIITIVTLNGTYELPLSALHLDQLADSLDVDIKDLQIKVVIQPVSADTQIAVDQAAGSVGAELIGKAPIQFSLIAETDSAQKKEITSFGDTYVKRTITLDQKVDVDHTTVVLYNKMDGTLSFVPAVFEIQEDGTTKATFMRNGNSVYAVVQANKSFDDIKDHWAKKAIELLTSKLIVAGETPVLFAPDQSITRAEFAGLIVRSLGLSGTPSSSEFDDVEADAWYAGEVALASDAGIVYGDGDGTFRPNDLITREELAAMVIRAMEYSGTDVDLTANEEQEVYRPYTDDEQVSTWARDSLAVAVQTKIVYGETSALLAPGQDATRAEATAMLKRYLIRTGFINE